MSCTHVTLLLPAASVIPTLSSLKAIESQALPTEPTKYVALQSIKETRPLPVLQRALTPAEQTQIVEACRQAAVVLGMDASAGSTSISLMGMVGPVRKVRPPFVQPVLL